MEINTTGWYILDYQSPPSAPAPPRLFRLFTASRCRLFQSFVNSPLISSQCLRISSGSSVRKNHVLQSVGSKASRAFAPVKAGKNSDRLKSKTPVEAAKVGGAVNAVGAGRSSVDAISAMNGSTVSSSSRSRSRCPRSEKPPSRTHSISQDLMLHKYGYKRTLFLTRRE